MSAMRDSSNRWKVMCCRASSMSAGAKRFISSLPPSSFHFPTCRFTTTSPLRFIRRLARASPDLDCCRVCAPFSRGPFAAGSPGGSHDRRPPRASRGRSSFPATASWMPVSPSRCPIRCCCSGCCPGSRFLLTARDAGTTSPGWCASRWPSGQSSTELSSSAVPFCTHCCFGKINFRRRRSWRAS